MNVPFYYSTGTYQLLQSHIFQSIVAGNKLQIRLHSKEEAETLHSRLRSFKSKYDKRFESVLGFKSLQNKIIKFETLSETESEVLIEVSLVDKVSKSKIKFEIIKPE